ncbi:MAG TPA: hypothetical protein DIU39_07120 [Flavobacteriales bacterium]|nr:hypothetical protein [Flavobacteriales bacterium]|tara:strand:+ start:76365 stop:76688 length:324 start_codon:yes stop_codon:yes gene_type:complete
MKIFSFIFALYIVVLNVYPCTDSDLAQINHDSVFENIPHKHQDSSDDTETCSPFCVCDCGVILTVQPIFAISFNILPRERKIEIPTTLTQKPKTISFSVWRPPTQTV